MKKLIIISFLLLTGLNGIGQSKDSIPLFETECNLDYGFVSSVDSQFIGGKREYDSFISMNIKYPEEAKKERIGGRVFVTMDIDTNGLVKNINILRGKHPILNKEVNRVLYTTNGKWKPFFSNGKKVDYQVTDMINFIID